MKTWSLDLGSTIGFKERNRFYTTTITYIHAQIQEFFVGFDGGSGGGGVQARLTKKALTLFFSLLFSVSPQLILQRGSSDNGFFKENYH